MMCSVMHIRRQKNVQIQAEMSLIKRNAMSSAWVRIRSNHCHFPISITKVTSLFPFLFFSPLPPSLPSAALDSLQEELLSMQEGVEQQERELKALRDHKLAQVNQAA